MLGPTCHVAARAAVANTTPLIDRHRMNFRMAAPFAGSSIFSPSGRRRILAWRAWCGEREDACAPADTKLVVAWSVTGSPERAEYEVGGRVYATAHSFSLDRRSGLRRRSRLGRRRGARLRRTRLGDLLQVREPRLEILAHHRVHAHEQAHHLRHVVVAAVDRPRGAAAVAGRRDVDVHGAGGH